MFILFNRSETKVSHVVKAVVGVDDYKTTTFASNQTTLPLRLKYNNLRFISSVQTENVHYFILVTIT